MSDSSDPETGDVLALAATERDGVVVVRTDEPYEAALLGRPDPGAIDGGELTVAVTKTVYSTDGTLETVFVSARPEPSAADAADGSLRELAEEHLDEALEVTGDEQSAVGAAKRRAKRQGRDPAIDPKLPEAE